MGVTLTPIMDQSKQKHLIKIFFSLIVLKKAGNLEVGNIMVKRSSTKKEINLKM